MQPQKKTASAKTVSGRFAHEPGNRWLTIGVCFFLAAAVWAVFGQTRHYQFINYDDPIYIYENPIVTQGLSLKGIVWILTHYNGLEEWFPLADISHMLDWQLYGSNAGGHHLTNVVLHAATAMFLFLVLRNMTGALWRSAFVAAVFAIHPLRVESVAWVVERKDVLSGLFFLLTLWAYARYARSKAENGETRAKTAMQVLSPRHWTLDYALALVFFALGLLSKTMIVTLPCVLLLLDYWPLGRMTGGTWQAKGDKKPAEQLSTLGLLFWEKIPFLLLSVAACVVTVLTQNNALLAVQGLTFLWRIGNALLAYTDYLEHMVYPVGLALVYSYPAKHLSVLGVGLSVLILLLISAGVIAGRRKYPYLLAGWLWYLGMLVPVIDNMQVAQNARADRYTYLPQIGLYILITWGVVELCGSWRYRRIVLGFAMVTVLAGLLAGAYKQTSYWKDSVSLWTHTLACTSENFLAHNNLGRELAAEGKWDEAIQHYEQALQINPNYYAAHLNLGNALAAQGKWDEAMQHSERALQLNPDDALALNNLGMVLAAQGKWDEAIQQCERALQLKPNVPETHYNLGNALAAQGKWDEALQHYERALQLKPHYAEACFHSGIVLAAQRKWDEAIQRYEQALQLKPDSAETHCNMGDALANQGKGDEAIQHYEQALQLKPNYADALNNLGVALAKQMKLDQAVQHLEQALRLKPDRAETHAYLGVALAAQGRPAEAMQHFERALQLKPDYAEACYYLGIALAGEGKSAEAIQHFQQALALATAQGNTALATSIRTRINSYPPASP